MAKENDKLKGKKVKWATYTISMWLSWAVLGYVNYFSTDHLHLNVGVVGTIFLASKILDAISNFIVATIVDNHKFKKGKGRPWNICIIPYWLCVIIMFSIPASLGTLPNIYHAVDVLSCECSICYNTDLCRKYLFKACIS